MDILDFKSDEVAEAIFYFLTENEEVYQAFCESCIENDFSMSEFVYNLYFDQFRDYCINALGFDVAYL